MEGRFHKILKYMISLILTTFKRPSRSVLSFDHSYDFTGIITG
jgi:hypothetical protein